MIPGEIRELMDELEIVPVSPGGRKRRAFFFCSYTPVEILKAAGYLPCRPLVGLHYAQGDPYLPPNMCSYVQAVLQWATGDMARVPVTIDPPNPGDIAVFVNSCNGMAHLYNVWNRLTQCSSFLLDLPHHRHEGAKRRYAGQIRMLAGWLREAAGWAADQDDIREARRLYLSLRREIAGLSRAISASSSRLPGSTAIVERLFALTTGGAAPEDSLHLVRNIKRLVETYGGTRPPTDERPRVLIAGTVGLPTLAQTIEAAGGEVVADERCLTFRGVRLNEGSPPASVSSPVTCQTRLDYSSSAAPGSCGGAGTRLYHEIAADYLDSLPCPRTVGPGRFVERVCTLSRDMQVDGTVLCALKFCDTMLYDIPVIKKKLSGAGIPVLPLTVDFREGVTGQVRTRIEAFVEMLKCRREQGVRF